MSKKAEAPQVPATLISLALEAAEIGRQLMATDGELTPELEARLDVNEQALMAKADAYKYILDEFESQAALWQRRKQACSALQSRFETQIDRLKDRIKSTMQIMEVTEIPGALYKLQRRKSAGKLVIENEAALPPDCKMVVTTTVPDKEKIKAALVAGFEIQGARLEESGSLVITENSGKAAK